jgi:conjugative element/phage-associated large polyvalent protein
MAFRPDAPFEVIQEPVAPARFDPNSAFEVVEEAVPAISQEEANRLYGEMSGRIQPEPSLNPGIGVVKDTSARAARGIGAATGQIIQGIGRFADLRSTPEQQLDKAFGIDSRNPVSRGAADLGRGIENQSREFYGRGIDSARDQNLLAQGAEMGGSLIPVIASGGYGAPVAGGLLMGEQGARQAEAEGRDVNRSFLTNTVGGALLNAVPALGVSKGAPALQRAIQGFNSGVVVNTAGDALLQLADTGRLDGERSLQNALIGGTAGATVGASMRSAPDVAAPPPRAQGEILPTLSLDDARSQYSQAIELETADALQRNLELQDQKAIDARIADQIAARELARPEFTPTLDGLPQDRAVRQLQLDETFSNTPARPAQESANAILAAEADQAMLAREAAAADAEMAASIPSEIQLSPKAQALLDESEGVIQPRSSRQAGFVDPAVARTLGGGAVGAGYGFATGDTPEERLARAAAFGLGGAAIGAGAPAIGRALSRGDGSAPRRTTGLELEPRASVNADRVAELAPLYQDVVARNPDISAAVDGRSLPVEIRRPDGSIEAAVVSGWQEYPATSMGGSPGEYVLRPNVGRMVNGAPSHGGLPAGYEIITPIPSYAEWEAGVQGIRSRIRSDGAPQLEAPVRTEPELAPVEEGYTIEPRGMEQLVLADAGYEPQMTYQVRRAGEERGVTMTARELREQGIPIPEAPVAGNAGGGAEPPTEGPSGPIQTIPDDPNDWLGPVPESIYNGPIERRFGALKRKLVDFAAPIEDTLRKAEREGGYEMLPTSDIRNNIDRVLVAPRIAGQFLHDVGFFDAIRETPNTAGLGQILTDLHALDVGPEIMGKGYDMNRAAANIQQNLPAYAAGVAKVRQASEALLGKAVEYGLISGETADVLNQLYPNYVPLNRVFGELEKTDAAGRKAITSLSRQSAIKKFEGGSERPIENPLGSFLTKAEDIFVQGERNKAANLLADYRTLPGFEGLIQEVPQARQKTGNMPDNTFSYLDNGVKRTFEAPKEIADAAKNLNSLTLDPLLRAVSAASRLARLTITGLDPSFALANFARDQGGSFVQGQNSARQIAAMPKAIFEALNHGPLYDEIVRQGAMQTQFDISRETPMATVDKIRSGRSIPAKVAYTVTHPSEWLKTVENVIGRSEEVARIQNFKAAYDAALASGMSGENAAVRAAQAARNTTANFNRRGEWGSVLNVGWLFLNAGVQGTRAGIRAVRRNPVLTPAKFGLAIAGPIAMATLWNTEDEARREAYADIPEFEKENNLIILPPTPVKDENGRWNAIKIPINPNFGSAATAVRRPVEQARQMAPVQASEMAAALLGTVSPIGNDPGQIISNATPMVARPVAEAWYNKNFYTNQDIVPERLKRLAPEFQYNDRTSTTAKWVGKQLGVSPLKVDHVFKGYVAGAGPIAINTAERAFGADNPGGRSIEDAFSRRFSSAAGGDLARRFYEANNEAQQARATYMMLMRDGRGEEAEAFREQNKRLIDFSRFMERQARRNKVLETDTPAEQQQQLQMRDSRMRQALDRLEGDSK